MFLPTRSKNITRYRAQNSMTSASSFVKFILQRAKRRAPFLIRRKREENEPTKQHEGEHFKVASLEEQENVNSRNAGKLSVRRFQNPSRRPLARVLRVIIRSHADSLVYPNHRI